MQLKYIFLILSIAVLFFIFFKKYDFGQRWKTDMGWKEYMSNMSSGSGTKMETVNVCGSCSASPCDNDYKEAKDLPLREYCVKSSFNSAYNGTDVSKETIQQRIIDGYRFIDFNVFSASGDIYVGYSPDNTPSLISNKMLLSDALKQISETAFSSSTVFESKMTNIASYPLFVHIRVYRKPGSNVDIVTKVENIINGVPDATAPSYTVHYLRDSEGNPTQITDCTKLSTLMGKMVFSMDILNILEIYAPIHFQDASTVPPDTIASLQKFVNVLTGGSTFPAFYKYTDDSLIHRTNKLGIGEAKTGGSLKTNVKHMYISFPHPDDVQKNGSNPKSTGVIQPSITSFILDRSIQFTPLRVYLADPNVDIYRNIFETVGNPFAPMSYVYQHLSTL
jgi:hypothetical protein